MKQTLPTFTELCVLEPGLRGLASDARRERRVNRKKSFYCANRVWYRDLKPRLLLLVGWGSRHSNPLMRTEAAYDVAYDTIYSLLPDCRNCQCDVAFGLLTMQIAERSTR